MRTFQRDPATLPFAATPAHVFDPGTQHRGQIGAALTVMGHAAPELDRVHRPQQESRIP